MGRHLTDEERKEREVAKQEKIKAREAKEEARAKKNAEKVAKRKAKEAERAQKKAAKEAEKAEKQAEREIKQAAKVKHNKKFETEEAREQAVLYAQNDWDDELKRIKDSFRIGEKIYRRFSCQELIAMFGGWFTLTYAFTIKNDVVCKVTNEEPETDFWICSQDVSGMKVNERPPLNTAIMKATGKAVYGFAIIAPSSAF